jgi:hypothetical protein
VAKKNKIQSKGTKPSKKAIRAFEREQKQDKKDKKAAKKAAQLQSQTPTEQELNTADEALGEVVVAEWTEGNADAEGQ